MDNMITVSAGKHVLTAMVSGDDDYPGIILRIDGVMVGALEYYQDDVNDTGEVKIHVWPTVHVDDEDPITTELNFD